MVCLIRLRSRPCIDSVACLGAGSDLGLVLIVLPTLGQAPSRLLRRWVVVVATAIAINRRHPACLHLLLGEGGSIGGVGVRVRVGAGAGGAGMLARLVLVMVMVVMVVVVLVLVLVVGVDSVSRATLAI